MLHLKEMTFNPFQENTYIVYNDQKEAIIFDPGCSNQHEREELISFIKSNKLIPKRLINTHCHIDHVLGNRFVAHQYDLKLEAHQNEKSVLGSCKVVSQMYGIPYEESPMIHSFISEGDSIALGDDVFEVFLCPGHSPGSLCFYNKDAAMLIGGDVLFMGSIGRTDLPGGDYNTLISSIKNKLFKLPDNTSVHSGHGPATNIGKEKRSNPFLN
jgi:glyoxylase-like metal-dependent hydrolase (beta-lactamase superfamily II)